MAKMKIKRLVVLINFSSISFEEDDRRIKDANEPLKVIIPNIMMNS